MPVPIIHLSRSFRAPQTTIRPALFIYQTSPLSSTSRFLYPQKGAEDKDSIDRESTEYSKSGTDDQSAAQEEAAFDADKTSPESQKEKAGEGNGGKTNDNPLDVSPANPDVSKQRSPTEGGAESSSGSSGASSERSRSSGGGSPNKGTKTS